MIVVEGPDGGGKTTLVEQIAGKYNFNLGIRGVADRDMLWTVTVSDTYAALGEAVACQTNPTVWDRLFFSEFIYAPVVGRKCEFTNGQKDYILQVLQALKCPIIYCIPPRAQVIKNSKETHQMDGVDGNIGRIYDRYVGQLSWPITKGQRLVYDYTKDEPDRVMKFIDNYLTRRRAREW